MDLAKPEIEKQDIEQKEIKDIEKQETNQKENKETNQKEIKEKKPNILIFSSLVFITNAITALYKNYYIYALIFFLLTMTSLAYHMNYTFYTSIVDKIMIHLLVLYGGYMLYNKFCTEDCNRLLTGIIVMFFLSNVYLYIYGYCIGDYCFHPELCVGNNYHALMHIMGSIGHHFIIFL
jgi:hypothetical protein